MIKSKTKAFIQAAVPPVLLLAWLAPSLQNWIGQRYLRVEQRRFIAATQRSLHPINSVVSRMTNLDEEEACQFLELPPDTAIKRVLDRILEDQGSSKYSMVETAEVRTFDPESQKIQNFHAFAVDRKDTGRRVFLLRYDEEHRYWAIQAYYVPTGQKPKN